MEKENSLYVHIPFCKKRCYYCDFNTFAGKDGQIDLYFEALKQEIVHMARNSEPMGPLYTIYLGGGTPSHVAASKITDLMQTIRTAFTVLPGSEITIEANPGTLTAQKLDQYIQAGINRISLGVQSANETELMQMGRIHTFTDVVENIALARKAGFTNISVDLIFGLPGQSLQTWMNSLEQVTALGIEHLSLYSLTIEEGTTFGRWVGRGMMSATDDDFMADQFTAAKEWLAVNGFSHYEISNWRKNDRERDFTSRHNCQYWLNEPYIGLGLGSHSCFRNQRIANASTLAAYIRANLQQSTGKHALFPACVAVDEIDKITEMNETMMLGLRLLEDGVSKTRFYQRYGEQMEVLFASEIDELIQQGLLQWLDDERLTLTKRGILLGNQAFIKFV